MSLAIFTKCTPSVKFSFDAICTVWKFSHSFRECTQVQFWRTTHRRKQRGIPGNDTWCTLPNRAACICAYFSWAVESDCVWCSITYVKHSWAPPMVIQHELSITRCVWKVTTYHSMTPVCSETHARLHVCPLSHTREWEAVLIGSSCVAPRWTVPFMTLLVKYITLRLGFCKSQIIVHLNCLGRHEELEPCVATHL